MVRFKVVCIPCRRYTSARLYLYLYSMLNIIWHNWRMSLEMKFYYQKLLKTEWSAKHTVEEKGYTCWVTLESYKYRGEWHKPAAQQNTKLKLSPVECQDMRKAQNSLKKIMPECDCMVTVFTGRILAQNSRNQSSFCALLAMARHRGSNSTIAWTFSHVIGRSVDTTSRNICMNSTFICDMIPSGHWDNVIQQYSTTVHCITVELFTVGQVEDY